MRKHHKLTTCIVWSLTGLFFWYYMLNDNSACETIQLTGRFKRTGSTGFWKGHEYWCFHTHFITFFRRYCNWFVFRPFLVDVTWSWAEGNGDATSVKSESFWNYSNNRRYKTIYTHGNDWLHNICLKGLMK